MTKRVSQYEFPSAKNLSRTRSPFMTPGTAYQHLERGSTHKVCWSNPLICPPALTLGVKRMNFSPLGQGSSVVEQGTHKPLVGSSNLPPGTPLLFRFSDIRLQIALAAANRRHETDATMFGHGTGPALLMNIAPAWEPQHCSGFAVAL